MTPAIAFAASCALTVATAVLAAVEAARMRRGRVAWGDIFGVASAGWFGLLAVLGWAWLIAGVLR